MARKGKEKETDLSPTRDSSAVSPQRALWLVWFLTIALLPCSAAQKRKNKKEKVRGLCAEVYVCTLSTLFYAAATAKCSREKLQKRPPRGMFRRASLG